jgi:hypothetical protein
VLVTAWADVVGTKKILALLATTRALAVALVSGAFPMKFVALATFVSFVSLVSVVSLCDLLHQNGRFSRDASYSRNGLLLPSFNSVLDA